MDFTPAPPHLVALWDVEDSLRDWDREAEEYLSRAEFEADQPGWADVAPMPSDADLLEAMLSRPANLLDTLLLADVDVSALPSKLLALKVSRRLDELAAMLAAKQSEVVVGLAGVEPAGEYLAERHVELEIAQGRTVSETTAGLDVELARSLHSTFPAFREALAAGRIREGHCRRLVQITRLTTDAEALARIAEKALPLAERLTPAQFAFQLRKLVASYDPDAEGRRKRATSGRDVWWEKLDDGQGRLVYTDEWHKVNALGIRIRKAGRATQVARKQAAAAARAGKDVSATASSRKSRSKVARKAAAAEEGLGPASTREADQATAAACRADALLALVLGAEQADGSVVLDLDGLVQVECQVVISLESLRGESERCALLDGQPIPAEAGRLWARRAKRFRRMVTDDVTGHLLDKGRAYLADDVRDFVLARDGCRVPGCSISHPDRLQADHAVEWPEGPTSSGNLGGLSLTHHQLKTAGYFDIADSQPDGSATITTLWGQRIVVPPRAFLHEPDGPGWRPSPPTTDPADDIPPF